MEKPFERLCIWKFSCLDVRTTMLMNEILLEQAHTMAEEIQLEPSEVSVVSR